MSDLYSEAILEYYKHPKNKKRLEKPDIYHTAHNPLCGDSCEIFVELDETKTKLEKVTWDGQGCAISVASTSILTKLVKDMSIKEALEFDKDDLLEMLGIKLSPNRLKCALLGLDTLKNGIRLHLGKNVDVKED
jgi:nitrogen fixation NifU-like protein